MPDAALCGGGDPRVCIWRVRRRRRSAPIADMGTFPLAEYLAFVPELTHTCLRMELEPMACPRCWRNLACLTLITSHPRQEQWCRDRFVPPGIVGIRVLAE